MYSNYKIQLIYPKRNYSSTRCREKLSHGKKAFIPPLNLCLIAALTPYDFEVSILDENNDDIDFTKHFDLVGITSMTSTAPRMYEIADTYRAKGIPVVLGGSHVSMLPEEALSHADAVVIGEAEGVWEKLLKDFKNGMMQRVYKAESYLSLDYLPHPRRDLLKKNGYYHVNTVQTSRGCPWNCSFCSVTKMTGKAHRFRPVEDVIDEIKHLKGRNIVGFTDDNIMGDHERAKELFRKLMPLKIVWGGQADINATQNAELLRLASESGCRALFIGFESISKDSLSEANKRINNPNKYFDIIKKIHHRKILILGSFVFGFDQDDKSVFQKTVQFAINSKLELAQFSVLTPFPGTDLHKKLSAERRILDHDWRKYTQGEVVFQPAKMTPEELKQGQMWAWNKFYSTSSIVKRTLRYGRWFPALFLANKFFSNINFLSVNPMIKLIQMSWYPFDRKVNYLDKA